MIVKSALDALVGFGTRFYSSGQDIAAVVAALRRPFCRPPLFNQCIIHTVLFVPHTH